MLKIRFVEMKGLLHFGIILSNWDSRWLSCVVC